MSNNENRVNSILYTVGEKAAELKQVVLANKFHKELETKSMAQILAEQLPASDAEQLQKDAAAMEDAIEQMYADMDTQVTDAWIKTRLNNALDGHDVNDQGKWLVSLLNCAVSANSEVLDDNARWQELRETANFKEADVADLMDLVTESISDSAGFMARQEFFAMEKGLDQLPQNLTEAQLNSGPAYAEAYAMAMYINHKRSGSTEQITAAQMGLMSANAVESSSLLAQYHLGKLRIQDLMAKLKNLAKKALAVAGEILLELVAIGVDAAMMYLAAEALFGILIAVGTAETLALIVSLVVVILAYNDYPHEETVAFVEDVWNGVKQLVQGIIRFFRGDNPGTGGAGAAVLYEEEQINSVTTVPTIYV